MKRSLGLSLVAATLLAGNAMAMDLAGGTLSGDVRALYLSESGNLDENAMGLGINPAFSMDVGSGLSFEVGAGIAVPVMESNDAIAGSMALGKVNEDGDASEMYAVLNKYNVTYGFGDGFVKVGAQNLDTPLAGSDDIRLVPNTFTAAVVGYTGVKNMTFIVADVMSMAGLVDGGADDAETYNAMSDQALGSAADDKDVQALAAIYNNEEAGANGQFWYYMMAEPVAGVGDITAMYLDAGMDFGGINAAIQYMDFTADAHKNSSTGLKIEAPVTDTVGVVAAYNSYSTDTVGSTPAWYAWGGYPEWAVADELWANSANWDGGNSMKLAAAFSGIEKLSLAAGYVAFSDVGAGIDVIADYEVSEEITAGLVYETVTLTDDYKTANGADDYNVMKIKAAYNF